MTRSTGSPYEVLCPYCGGTITHIRKLKIVRPNTRIRCKRKECGRESVVERAWIEDGVWPRITLVEGQMSS